MTNSLRYNVMSRVSPAVKPKSLQLQEATGKEHYYSLGWDVSIWFCYPPPPPHFNGYLSGCCNAFCFWVERGLVTVNWRTQHKKPASYPTWNINPQFCIPLVCPTFQGVQGFNFVFMFCLSCHREASHHLALVLGALLLMHPKALIWWLPGAPAPSWLHVHLWVQSLGNKCHEDILEDHLDLSDQVLQ